MIRVAFHSSSNSIFCQPDHSEPDRVVAPARISSSSRATGRCVDQDALHRADRVGPAGLDNMPARFKLKQRAFHDLTDAGTVTTVVICCISNVDQ